MTDNDKQEEARKTAEATTKALKEKGWCFWRCHEILEGDIITVMRDNFTPSRTERQQIIKQLGALYEKYGDKVNREQPLGTVYYEYELKQICEASNIWFLHQAKKLGGTLLPGGEE